MLDLFKFTISDCVTHLQANMKLGFAVYNAMGMFALANAHGYFVSPKAREPGPAYQKSCGMQAYNMMSGDINGNIQGLEQVVANQPDYNPATCHLWSVLSTTHCVQHKGKRQV